MSKVPAVHTVDFETKKIESRPEYPPEPVGVSIRLAGERKARYYAWGHPTNNNCTKAEAARVLKTVWKSGVPLLFHNGKFDVDVAETHFGLSPLPWPAVHDTMFLAFLHNPHAIKIDLKSLAEEILDEPPTERDELHEWILSHVFTAFKGGEGSVVVAEKKPEGFFKIPPSLAGGFISYAPGDLAGRYADGDVNRTFGLFKKLYKEIFDRGMGEAYDRERRLMPVLLKSERRGVPVNYRKLKKDIASWERSIEEVDAWIAKRLKTPDLEVDKAAQLADAIEKCDKVDEWILTPGGDRSTSKENLIACVTDKTLVEVLGYRALIVNSLRNFGRPWLRMAEASDGSIFTNWNQVRSAKDNRSNKGARTGRLSSNPNFQNISKKPPVISSSWAEVNKLRRDGSNATYLPAALMKLVAELPFMRGYIIPRKGHIILDRDYSQQELRILGHYEDGVLLDAYLENPHLDLHDFAKDLINSLLGTNIERKPIKNLGFGLIYGMGLAKTADEMGVDRKTAKMIKDAYLQIFPGLGELIKELESTGKADEAIRTWGGREYYVEPPKFDKKRRRWMTYEYKLLNVLIQGSAADCTKEAIIRVDEATRDDTFFLMSVHDQLVYESGKAQAKSEMAAIREAMESIEFDIPMLSDGKWSTTSWGDLKKFKEAA